MKPGYYQGTPASPTHLSVGAVLLNDQDQIAAHYFRELSVPGQGRAGDFYVLMRETVEPGETLEQAIQRGLLEEFGATADIKDYIGSIVSHFPEQGSRIEKTTLYFLCRLKSWDAIRRKADDPEAVSQIQFCEPDYLIVRMRQQAQRFGRSDLDESMMLEKVKQLLAIQDKS